MSVEFLRLKRWLEMLKTEEAAEHSEFESRKLLLLLLLLKLFLSSIFKLEFCTEFLFRAEAESELLFVESLFILFAEFSERLMLIVSRTSMFSITMLLSL